MSDTLFDRPDVVDRAAGLRLAEPLFALRAHRPEFLHGAEACWRAVLQPGNDLGLPDDLRLALARRVALTAESPALLAEYPMPQAASLAALAEGGMPEEPKLAALATHADMIARDPKQAAEAHLTALLEVGFTVPQVVALSQLLAFVCFQIRVVHGLSLLRETEQ